MGMVRLEKASNVARDLFLIMIIHKITKDGSLKKHIGEKTVGSIYAQQYSRR